ncbi:MAG TPA: hypothetical protein VGD67_09430 [Pseudonocardiaceae bacterium]
MPDPVIVTPRGRLRLTGLDLRVPYTLYCRLYDCSFDQLGRTLENFRPLEQPHLELRFLQPVSRLVAGSGVTLIEHTFPRLGPVVVETGVTAATDFFRTGRPDFNATGTVDLRARVWRELHFYVNGELQVNGGAQGLEVDHGQFTFGFRLSH